MAEWGGHLAKLNLAAQPSQVVARVKAHPEKRRKEKVRYKRITM